MSGDVTIRRRHFGGCVLVAVTGDVDVNLANEILAVTADVADGFLVLDLRLARAVHPSAAQALAELHRCAWARGGSVCLVATEPRVRSQVTNGDVRCVPHFYDDIGEALEASMTAREAARRAASWTGQAGTGSPPELTRGVASPVTAATHR